MSRSDVGNHLRDEERAELRTFVLVLTIICYFVLECLDTADTHAINDADTVHVFLLEVETRVLHALHCANHSQLRVTVELAGLLTVNPVVHIEVFHLAGELGLEEGSVKMSDRSSPTLSCNKVLPGFFRRVSHRSNRTETCYNYSL